MRSLIILSYCVVLAFGNSDVIRVKKVPPEVELKTCIDNFDIHKDKIIRTQDSRDMGAKYLNEIDLGSREECLRLCCETNSCDVFVFEEKSPGSCYLFHCGPPEDFKCKFTRHVNYSSAVLAISRHSELESEIKMTKHEEDLARLRKPDTDGNLSQDNIPKPTTRLPIIVPVTSPTTQEPVISHNKDIFLGSVNTGKHTGGRTCTHYQFECRSTSECIAIYNACDGIPQCTDGSDEAPELGCPEASTVPPAIIVSPSFSPLLAHQQLSDMKNILHSNPDNYFLQQMGTKYSDKELESPRNINQPIGYETHQEDKSYNPRANSIGIPPPRALPVMSAPYNPNSNLLTNSHINPQQWSRGSDIQTDNFQGRSNIQSPYIPDQGSHIFNHKVNSIQVGEANADSMTGMRYGEIPKRPNYYNTLYRPQIQAQLPEPGWQGVNNQDSTANNNPVPYLPPDLRENWQQMQLPQSMLNNPNPAYYPPEQEIPNWKTDKLTDTKKNGFHLEQVAPTTKEIPAPVTPKKTTTEHPTQPVHSAPKKNKPIHHNEAKPHFTPVAAELRVSDDVEIIEMTDGVPDSPSGAILSLTLGICITMIMVGIVGCRLRGVRKRLRRGGKSPYAHDADYLVNGMYL